MTSVKVLSIMPLFFHKVESSSFDVLLVINCWKFLVIEIHDPKYEPLQSHFIFVLFEAAQINLVGGFNSFFSLYLNYPPGGVSEYV